MENETKKLEILVVEDILIHQEAARELLKEHNVTVIDNFDDAADRIHGRNFRSPEGVDKVKYDVVLTDMFFTQGRGDCMADKNIARQEMPFGYAVALMAIQEGTSYVAIMSDANHHSNPIAYTMDFFKAGNDPKVMNLDAIGAGSTRLMVVNTSILKNPVYRTPEGKIGSREEITTGETRNGRPKIPEGSEQVKNYRSVLDKLLDEDYNPKAEE